MRLMHDTSPASPGSCDSRRTVRHTGATTRVRTFAATFRSACPAAVELLRGKNFGPASPAPLVDRRSPGAAFTGLLRAGLRLFAQAVRLRARSVRTALPR